MSASVIRPVGAHTPTSGGLAKAALPYLDATGAEVVQVYVSNSRGWALPPGDPRQDELFRAGCAERGVPVFIHASLLVNLGSPTPATVERS
ncbi:endonuclease IV, partial [Micromonospora azadirachtae]